MRAFMFNFPKQMHTMKIDKYEIALICLLKPEKSMRRPENTLPACAQKGRRLNSSLQIHLLVKGNIHQEKKSASPCLLSLNRAWSRPLSLVITILAYTAYMALTFCFQALFRLERLSQLH